MLQKTLIIGLLVFFSCKNAKNVSQDSINYTNVIEQHLGNNYERADRLHLALCYTVDKKNMTNWRTVMVIDTTNAAILYGPEKINGKISWHEDRKLLIKETPEVIKDKQSTETYSYIYNLDTKEKESSRP